MALLKCPECGNNVSELASCCPKCGCPISAIKKSNSAKKVRTNNKRSKINSSNKSFYNSLSPKDKKVINEFRKICKELNQKWILKKTITTYGFLAKLDSPTVKSKKAEHYRICWISKDKKKKLVLRFKITPTSAVKVYSLTTSQKRLEAWRQLKIALLAESSIDSESYSKRIKSGDQFGTYKTKNKIGVTLMPHQKAGVELASKYDRFAFFYDTGTGKTIMSLEIMMNKYKENGTKFLVIAPKALIKTAWMDDSKYFKDMKILPLSSNMTIEDYARLYDYWQVMDGKERAFTDSDGYVLEKIGRKFKDDIMNELYAKAHHFITNLQKINKPSQCDELLNKTNCKGLVIDESVTIKSFYREGAKTARRLASKMDYVYILSGKPAPNNISEYYAQMTIIDPETFPPHKYKSFINQFFMASGKYGKLQPKAGAYNKIGKMVSNRSITISKEDCLKLPEKSEQIRQVDVDDQTMDFYESVLKNFVAEIKTMSGQNIRNHRMNKMASIMKLREVASGFYLDNTNSWRLNKKKIDAIKKLIREIGVDQNGKQNKVLIWCTFVYEIESLYKELIKAGYKVETAYSKTKDTSIPCNNFQNGDTEILIAHPQTLAYGVTLTNCHYCIYSSMSYSYNDYYQSESRIIRKGQNNLCMFYFMQSANTIDETIYKCVVEKAKNTKIFERIIKTISKHGYSKSLVYDLLKSPNNVITEVINDKDINGYN